MKVIQHPVLGNNYRLLFDEAAHAYRISTDPDGWQTYHASEWDAAAPVPSVTQFVGHYMPKFDAPGISAQVAERRGTTPEAVQAEWAEAAEMGTRVHENQEDFMHARPPRHQPRSAREHGIMSAGWTAFQQILEHGWIPLASEKMVFSYGLQLAGTIDAMFRRGREVMLVDWKTNKEIRARNRFGEKCLEPIAHLDACELVRYTLQLNLYERILKEDGYVPMEQATRMNIIHLRPGGEVVMPIENTLETERLLLHFRKDNWMVELPF